MRGKWSQSWTDRHGKIDLLSSSQPSGGVPGGETNTGGAEPGGLQSSPPLSGSPFCAKNQVSAESECGVLDFSKTIYLITFLYNQRREISNNSVGFTTPPTIVHAVGVP